MLVTELDASSVVVVILRSKMKRFNKSKKKMTWAGKKIKNRLLLNLSQECWFRQDIRHLIWPLFRCKGKILTWCNSNKWEWCSSHKWEWPQCSSHKCMDNQCKWDTKCNNNLHKFTNQRRFTCNSSNFKCNESNLFIFLKDLSKFIKRECNTHLFNNNNNHKF